MISPFYKKQLKHINIHVYKTNIENESEALNIKTLLSSNPKIQQCSIDLEDVDKVLRIEASKSLHSNEIIEKIISEGYFCEELA